MSGDGGTGSTYSGRTATQQVVCVAVTMAGMALGSDSNGAPQCVLYAMAATTTAGEDGLSSSALAAYQTAGASRAFIRAVVRSPLPTYFRGVYEVWGRWRLGGRVSESRFRFQILKRRGIGCLLGGCFG